MPLRFYVPRNHSGRKSSNMCMNRQQAPRSLLSRGTNKGRSSRICNQMETLNRNGLEKGLLITQATLFLVM